MPVTITNISRTSFHDGPGIRTVVYFNGCKMRCEWCHNPETISRDNEILYVKDKCIHCGRCLFCENHITEGDDMIFKRKDCKKCGKCAIDCPSGALTVCGKEYSPESLFKEIEKDRLYFEESGGGVTLSGGECLLQPAFCQKFLKLCKENEIDTLIETALFMPWENIEALVPYTDRFYCDLKLANSASHKKYTGVDNRIIIENLKKLSLIHKDITVRIPLIPNVNDSVEDMADFAKIINTLGEISGIELLAYNYLAKGKYTVLGQEYVSFGETAQTDEHKQRLANTLKANLIKPTKVYFR